MQKSKISHKLNILNLYILIITSIVLLIVYFFERQKVIKKINIDIEDENLRYIKVLEIASQVSVKNYLKAVADNNLFFIRGIYNEYMNNNITKEEALEIISKNLLSQKIADEGYIYAFNSKGEILIHPVSSLVGKSLYHYEFIYQQIRQKNGYQEYKWANPGERNRREKAMYGLYFKEWDLIISVSAYKDEFKKLINVDDFRKEILGINKKKIHFFMC